MLYLDRREQESEAAAAIGLPPPLPAAGCAAAGSELSILSLSPEAYLLLTPPNRQYALLTQLGAALSNGRAAVFDVSSGYSTFRLFGPAASTLLCRGCSAPLDPPHFTRGKCMTTRIGKFAVIIHRLDDRPGFDLHVGRSFALAFWSWLSEVGRVCGLTIERRVDGHPAGAEW
jgi:sarcosine oxidase subunit gamma